jgi:Ca2+-binding RTX toxin-like protein
VLVDLKLNLVILGPAVKFNVSNLRNVVAGSGDTLVVGNGNNFFQGGSGRDVFTSGSGNSTLVAGSGEAILIGGTTLWDTNVAALDAILAEWGSTYDPINPLIDYRIRVGHLEHGGGKNGPFLLNPATVHSNFAKDTLVTNLAGGLDFVFFDVFDFLPHGARFGEVFVPV